MLDASTSALESIFSCPCVLEVIPLRLVFLALGSIIGLIFGVIPGLGGVVGLAIILPFTFDLDPFAAIAMMIGVLATNATSDSIPAVFFAVPGTTGAQATIMDGHPMARNGEAGRALGAAYMSSMLGGIIGAIALAAAIPVVQPIVRSFGAPEFLMLALMGISMVGVMSGRAVLKGLLAGAIGLALGLVGQDPFVGSQRWLFGTLYLWEGIDIVPLSLGLFAIPEIVDIAIKGTRISDVPEETGGVLDGIKDTFRHWFLVLRCSIIGVFLGAIPGVGVSVIDWLTYGHAMQTCKGARETFTKGDVRGVIAPESATNSKTGGTLVPTLAFGVPGSAAMALFLSGLMIVGFTPGPDLLTTRLDVTYAMIWSLAFATILGTVVVLLLSVPLAKLSMVRIHLLAPIMFSVVFVASFQASSSLGDIWTLLAFGLLGWVMKRFGWPRPPFILAFVLAPIVERNLFLSINIYGAAWLVRPLVLVIGILIAGILAYGGVTGRRDRQRRLEERGAEADDREGEGASLGGGSTGVAVTVGVRPTVTPGMVFTSVVLVVFAILLVLTFDWPWQARLMPTGVTLLIVVLGVAELFMQRWRAAHPADSTDVSGIVDLPADNDLPNPVLVRRILQHAGWLLGLTLLTLLFGFLVSVPVYLMAYLLLMGRERLHVAVITTVGTYAFMIATFHYLLRIAWYRPPIALPQELILTLLRSLG